MAITIHFTWLAILGRVIYYLLIGGIDLEEGGYSFLQLVLSSMVVRRKFSWKLSFLKSP